MGPSLQSWAGAWQREGLPAFRKHGLPLLQEEWAEKAARRYRPLPPWLPGQWGPAHREERAGERGLGPRFPGLMPLSEGWAAGHPGEGNGPGLRPSPTLAPSLPASRFPVSLTLLPVR